MLFTQNSDPIIRMSQQNLRLIRPGKVFYSFGFQFVSSLVNCSLRSLFLSDRSGTQRDRLLLKRCYFGVQRVVRSERLICITLLFQVLLLFSSDSVLQTLSSLRQTAPPVTQEFQSLFYFLGATHHWPRLLGEVFLLSYHLQIYYQTRLKSFHRLRNIPTSFELRIILLLN